MSDKQPQKTSAVSWALIGLMVVGVGASVYVVKSVLSDDSPRRKSSTTTVTLLKPPPPQVREKPPEPEPVKQVQKEEVIADIPQNAAQQDKPAGEPDNAPAGSNLGVDAVGGAGGDAFGLVGNKGGRSILAGGGGSGGGSQSLLTRYSGYVQNVQAEIQKKVMQRLDEQGWFPKGKLQASIRIVVDSNGRVTEYRLIGSSGNHKLDEAAALTLNNYKFREPPPNGKTNSMVIRISSQS
jgi:TonB family protein